MERQRWLTLYNNSCLPVTQEESATLTPTTGEVPKDLRGTLYRNGPGRFAVGKDHYSHPFDGDGMVSRFQFRDGLVHFRNAYVKTAEFTREEAAGQMLFRGFGSNRPGGLLTNALRTKFKNAANTNIVHHGGRLLALWEGGWPHELDPFSLATLRRQDFSGRLKNGFGILDGLMNPELPFSAHPKIDPTTGRLYNFGLAFGTKNRLLLYEVDTGGAMAAPRFLNLGDLSFVHDFTITAGSKAIFFCSPVHFNLPSMLLGLKTPAAGMSGNTNLPVRVLVVDLNGPPGEISPSDIQVFEVPYSFVFHHINAFERDGEFHIYSCEMPTFPSADDARKVMAGQDLEYPRTQLVHYKLSPGRRVGTRQPHNVHGFELPRVCESEVGLTFKNFYAAGVENPAQFPFMDQIQKISIEGQYSAKYHYPDGLIGEPVHVPTANGAYVLSLCYNDRVRKSELVILNATDLKLAASLILPQSQPIGFHGNWVAENSL